MKRPREGANVTLEQEEPIWRVYRAYLIAAQVARRREGAIAELLEFAGDDVIPTEAAISRIEGLLDETDEELERADNSSDFALTENAWNSDEINE